MECVIAFPEIRSVIHCRSNGSFNNICPDYTVYTTLKSDLKYSWLLFSLWPEQVLTWPFIISEECYSQHHFLGKLSFKLEKLLSLPSVLYLSSSELFTPPVYKLDILKLNYHMHFADVQYIYCMTMYTCQMQKSVQEMKHLQKILEVSYDTLSESEDHEKVLISSYRDGLLTLTSITAVVDRVKKAPHPLIFCQRIKIKMMSFS